MRRYVISFEVQRPVGTWGFWSDRVRFTQTHSDALRRRRRRREDRLRSVAGDSQNPIFNRQYPEGKITACESAARRPERTKFKDSKRKLQRQGACANLPRMF